MKTKVICLVGASGTGKTYIAKELSKLDNINVIQSYTTRPLRYKDEWGHTFIEDCFISYNPDNSINYISEGISASSKSYWAKDMIAYFNSYNSGHHYFVTDEQVIRGKTNIYVVDPEGAEQVKEYYKKHNEQELAKQGMKYHEEYKRDDVEVITITIYEDNGTVCQRLIEREIQPIEGLRNRESVIKKQMLEAVNSMNDRMAKDKELFKVIKCDYSIKGSSNALEFIKKELL